ncbi:hypothetical protein FA15DRAFT_710228 [Coprinopsis marcescibilis]|uniref:Uncharacterized protein n=1 Tax=Coprinopsis marcescibilis TaxID=230819 RepID=A0A5C3KEH4_COPMA|nr:hypothetical protein FA15DRAFT_710228 [Coprinopsis marcescibilis]
MSRSPTPSSHRGSSVSRSSPMPLGTPLPLHPSLPLPATYADGLSKNYQLTPTQSGDLQKLVQLGQFDVAHGDLLLHLSSQGLQYHIENLLMQLLQKDNTTTAVLQDVTKIFKGSACMTEDDKANVLRVIKDMMVSPTVLAYTTIDGKIMRVVNLMAKEKWRTQQAVVKTPSISQTFDRLVGTFDLSLFTSPSAPPQPSNSNQRSRSRSPSSNRGHSRPPTPSSSFGALSRPLAADPQYQFPASPIPASSLGPRRSILQQHHLLAPSIDNHRHISQQHQHSPAPSFNTHHPIPEQQHHCSPVPTFDVHYPVPTPNRHTAPSHLNVHGPGQPPHQRALPFETPAHQRPSQTPQHHQGGAPANFQGWIPEYSPMDSPRLPTSPLPTGQLSPLDEDLSSRLYSTNAY